MKKEDKRADMYRRAVVQKSYFEFILRINNIYKEIQKYPEFFRMIIT